MCVHGAHTSALASLEGHDSVTCQVRWPTLLYSSMFHVLNQVIQTQTQTQTRTYLCTRMHTLTHIMHSDTINPTPSHAHTYTDIHVYIRTYIHACTLTHLFIYLLKAYSPVNRKMPPQGFLSVQTLHKSINNQSKKNITHTTTTTNIKHISKTSKKKCMEPK